MITEVEKLAGIGKIAQLIAVLASDIGVTVDELIGNDSIIMAMAKLKSTNLPVS